MTFVARKYELNIPKSRIISSSRRQCYCAVPIDTGVEHLGRVKDTATVIQAIYESFSYGIEKSSKVSTSEIQDAFYGILKK